METVDFFWWKLPKCFSKLIESLSYYEVWLLVKYMLEDDENYNPETWDELCEDKYDKAYMLRLFIKELNENKNEEE